MKTYSAIKAEIAKLQEQAEAALKSEISGVVQRIKEAIAAYGLTAADLGFGGKTKKATGKGPIKAGTGSTKTVGVAKYRDPKTQKTWTGRGKPPGWIAGVKNREAYLISGAQATSAQVESATKRAKKAPAAKGSKTGQLSPANKARATGKSKQPSAVTPAVQIESGAGTE